MSGKIDDHEPEMGLEAIERRHRIRMGMEFPKRLPGLMRDMEWLIEECQRLADENEALRAQVADLRECFRGAERAMRRIGGGS